jgi:DNA polymerase IV
MAVFYAHIPDFVLRVMHHTDEAGPVLYLGPDDLVHGCSPAAASSGVIVGMSARQAKTRCPDAQLIPMDAARVDEAQHRFVSVLRDTGLPVEVAGPGQAYCDLSPVTASPTDALPVCSDLGRQLRAALGDGLVPALGCDHGKFTARAAAHVARPGRLRVVDADDEQRFLAPLPVTLLPLPLQTQRELIWLGVDTLDALAKLPTASVLQRWGKPGVAAQKLAQGRDARPVQPGGLALPAPVNLDFEPMCESAEHAATALRRALGPAITALAEQLAGCQTLTLTLRFLDQQTQTRAIALAAPVFTARETGAALLQALRNPVWPAPLRSAGLTINAVGEMPTGQLALFETEPEIEPATEAQDARTRAAAQRLSRKYPGAFWVARLTQPTHRAPERRATWRHLDDEAVG